MKRFKVWITLMCFASIVMITASISLGDSLQGEASVELGYSMETGLPYTIISISGMLRGFTAYGDIRTDIFPVGWRTYGPIRSVYGIGLSYTWRHFEIGWRHQCTHRGDYSTDLQWYETRMPNVDDLYVKFVFGSSR